MNLEFVLQDFSLASVQYFLTMPHPPVLNGRVYSVIVHEGLMT